MWVEVVLGVTLLFLLWQVLKKPSDLPPGQGYNAIPFPFLLAGRWGLPLVGSVPLSLKTFEDHLRDLQKQHGNIYLWRIGSRVLVFLHDQKMVREAFTGTDFIDRPHMKMFTLNESSPKGECGAML
ncbi:Cytochrome P450 2L1 [Chionoecetes opilio]|uniref:Cytochrome P450 2L1 n=1 Tax=Chionoecetes opilio TaxID=41210 RepID=A0A8J4YFY2_CHIOP|nr:Cytochrome P450 2L1 [Chionoecetes opilio]